MAEFILTGFGDEIDAALDVQMDVMEKLDIHYIETRGIDGKNIADYAPAEAKAVFARMQARGFGVSALGSPIGKISIRDPFLPHLDSFRNLLDVAHAMQTQYIRIFSFFLPECEPAETFRDEVLERLGRLVEAARGSGVQLLHENEKHIYGDVPERCLEILKAFPGEILATYDPSNFVQCGVKNREAFEMLRPYVRYLHVKDSVYTGKTAVADKGFDTVTDAHRPAGLGDGELPWILGELKKMDYRGFARYLRVCPAGTFVPGTGADKFAARRKRPQGALGPDLKFTVSGGSHAQVRPYDRTTTTPTPWGSFPPWSCSSPRPESVRCLLVDPAGYRNAGVAKLIEACRARRIPVEEAPRAVERISGKENAWCVTVLGKYACRLDPLRSHVVLHNPSDVGNVGTILRSALGFGFRDVAIIRPGVDPFDPRVLRASWARPST